MSQEDKTYEAEEMARLKTGIPVRRYRLLIELAPDMVMGQTFKVVSLCTHKIKSLPFFRYTIGSWIAISSKKPSLRCREERYNQKGSRPSADQLQHKSNPTT